MVQSGGGSRPWTVGDRHPRLWCAWGTSDSFAPFARLRAPREKINATLRVGPVAACTCRRHVAKVGPMDPGSCMRRYISVLRLNRPESATIYGFNWGWKPSTEDVVQP
eukprot:7341747-Prymnesium_polylepis.1